MVTQNNLMSHSFTAQHDCTTLATLFSLFRIFLVCEYTKVSVTLFPFCFVFVLISDVFFCFCLFVQPCFAVCFELFHVCLVWFCFMFVVFCFLLFLCFFFFFGFVSLICVMSFLLLYFMLFVLSLANQHHFSVKGLVVFGKKMQTGGVFLQSIWLFAREVHV